MPKYGGATTPDVDSVWNREKYPYGIISAYRINYTDIGPVISYSLNISSVPLECSGTAIGGTGPLDFCVWNFYPGRTTFWWEKSNEGHWSSDSRLTFGSLSRIESDGFVSGTIWSNFDIIDTDGVVRLEATPPEYPELVEESLQESFRDRKAFYLGWETMRRITSQVNKRPETLSIDWCKTSMDTVTELDIVDIGAPEVYDSVWNADEADVGRIKCYLTGTKLTLVGNGAGKILAPVDSSYLFSNDSTSSAAKYFTALKKITGLELLDTSNVTTMAYMFKNCNAVQALDVSGFDTSQVTTMAHMFQGCNAVQTLDVSGFDTSKVATFAYMFYGCTSVQQLDVSNFITEKATSFGAMFWGCCEICSIDVSGFVTGNSEDFGGMFSGCRNLQAIDISNFDLSIAVSFGSIFKETGIQEMDLSGIYAPKLRSFSNVFENCTNLKKVNMSDMVVPAITQANHMFSGCIALTEIDFTNVSLASNIHWHYMFYNCASLTTLNLSSFNTKSARYCYYMFCYCKNLQTIYTGANWDFSHVTYALYKQNMYTDCPASLVTV